MDFDKDKIQCLLQKVNGRLLDYLSSTNPIIPPTSQHAAQCSTQQTTSTPPQASPKTYRFGAAGFSPVDMRRKCLERREPTPPSSPNPRRRLSLVENANGLSKKSNHNAQLTSVVNTSTEFGGDFASFDQEIVDKLLDEFFHELLPLNNKPGAGFFCYIPSGGLIVSAMANFIASSVNTYVGLWQSAPLLVQVESNVILWLCSIMGYSSTAFGVLTGGGSASNMMAPFIARRSIFGDELDFYKGTVYMSSQSHGSMSKACIFTGVPTKNIRIIPNVENGGQMCMEALQSQIDLDRSRGLIPFLVVGNAGSTNCGEVDFLEEMAEISQRENMWFHIDGAYGGLFHMTKRGQQALRGISMADSITIDPHKTLSMALGTSAFLVKDKSKLTNGFTFDNLGNAHYLPDNDDSDCVDFVHISMETTREFRGLRIWLPLKLYGIEEFTNMLDEKLDLAQWLHQKLLEVPGIECMCSPALSLFSFRYNPFLLEDSDFECVDEAETEAVLTSINKSLLNEINAKERVTLSSTTYYGKFVLRICVLRFDTHMEQVQQCLEDILHGVKIVSKIE